MVRANGSSLLKSAHSALAPDEALRAQTGVLIGVSTAAEAALETIDVRTVFDLAASHVFATADRLALSKATLKSRRRFRRRRPVWAQADQGAFDLGQGRRPAGCSGYDA